MSRCGALAILALTISAAASDAAWQRLDELPGAEVVLDLIEATDHTLYAATYPGGSVFVSMDGGATWEEAAALPGAIMTYALAERPDGAVVAGTFPRGDLFVTADRGLSWSHLPGPPAPAATELHALLVASNGLLYAGCAPDGHVFRSPDGGLEWFVAAQLPEATVPWCLAEGPPGTLWAGTSVGTGLFRSTNGGNDWSAIGTFRVGTFELDVPNIAAVLPETASGSMYAAMVRRGHGSAGGVFESADGGQNWQLIDGLEGVAGVWDLLETANGEIWAGLGTREEEIVYRWSPGGGWASTGPLADAREVFALLQTAAGDILAGTAPHGHVFRFTPTGTGIALAGAPRTPLILSSHPNPFSVGADISFRIDAAGPVSLAIYAPDGRRLRTLIDGLLAAGHHEIVWNGRGRRDSRLSSGIYFCLLRAGGRVQTRKLVLISP